VDKFWEVTGIVVLAAVTAAAAAIGSKAGDKASDWIFEDDK